MNRYHLTDAIAHIGILMCPYVQNFQSLLWPWRLRLIFKVDRYIFNIYNSHYWILLHCFLHNQKRLSEDVMCFTNTVEGSWSLIIILNVLWQEFNTLLLAFLVHMLTTVPLSWHFNTVNTSPQDYNSIRVSLVLTQTKIHLSNYFSIRRAIQFASTVHFILAMGLV